jgi:DNA-binding LacI/PurR family transcriptional regulator
MGRHRATLQTVAERVGVSRSTVSNAYNRPDQLSADLRDRILAAAAELGYAGPDPAARSLRQGKSGAIGLMQGVLWAVTDPANLLMLAGVAEVWEELGLALVLIGSAGDDDRPDVLATTNLDGLIAHCDGFDARRRRNVRDRGIPLVVVDQGKGDDATVGIDEEGGAAAAVEHLVGLGHRRIGVVTIGDDVDDGSVDIVADRRLAGYRAAAGTGVELVIAGRNGYTREAGNAACRELLARQAAPTAIVAMSDELAAGVVDAAVELGRAVPAELSVVGFDDSPTAAACRPPLTTVFQDHREKGRTAVRVLLGLQDESAVELPTRLVVRESTAPPAR